MPRSYLHRTLEIHVFIYVANPPLWVWELDFKTFPHTSRLLPPLRQGGKHKDFMELLLLLLLLSKGQWAWLLWSRLIWTWMGVWCVNSWLTTYTWLPLYLRWFSLFQIPVFSDPANYPALTLFCKLKKFTLKLLSLNTTISAPKSNCTLNVTCIFILLEIKNHLAGIHELAYTME